MSKVDYNDLQKFDGWSNFSTEINRRLNADFNFIQLGIVKKVFAVGGHEEESNEYENIHQPSQDILFKEWWNDLSQDEQDQLKEDCKNDLESLYNDSRFMEWLQEEKDAEIFEHYNDRENYPMWNTLFEARDSFLAEKIQDKADDIYSVIGLGVMNGDEDGLLNTMLFMSSAGHSFLNDYWCPLYVEVFEWVRLEDFFTKNELKKVGWSK